MIRTKTDGSVTYIPTRQANVIDCPKRCGLQVYAGLDDDICAADARANLYPVNLATAQFLADNDRDIYYLDICLRLWRLDEVPKNEWTRRRLLAQHICQKEI